MSRASNLTKQQSTEVEFTRAAWDMFRDTELEYSVQIALEVVPTAQRGVFYIGIQARSTAIEEKGRRLAYVQGSYPNSRAGTLSAYLFALSNSLAQMVENVREEARRQAVAR